MGADLRLQPSNSIGSHLTQQYAGETVQHTVRHVIRNKDTYATSQLCHILEAYVGHVSNRQKLHDLLHNVIAWGHFPNARQERPFVPNSLWILTRVDILAYLEADYPQGTLPHFTAELEVT